MFIMRLEGEAKEARHRPALPSLVGASAGLPTAGEKSFRPAPTAGRQDHLLKGFASSLDLGLGGPDFFIACSQLEGDRQVQLMSKP